jgi:hypothetical protein
VIVFGMFMVAPMTARTGGLTGPRVALRKARPRGRWLPWAPPTAASEGTWLRGHEGPFGDLIPRTKRELCRRARRHHECELIRRILAHLGLPPAAHVRKSVTPDEVGAWGPRFGCWNFNIPSPCPNEVYEREMAQRGTITSELGRVHRTPEPAMGGTMALPEPRPLHVHRQQGRDPHPRMACQACGSRLHPPMGPWMGWSRRSRHCCRRWAQRLRNPYRAEETVCPHRFEWQPDRTSSKHTPASPSHQRAQLSSRRSPVRSTFERRPHPVAHRRASRCARLEARSTQLQGELVRAQALEPFPGTRATSHPLGAQRLDRPRPLRRGARRGQPSPRRR